MGGWYEMVGKRKVGLEVRRAYMNKKIRPGCSSRVGRSMNVGTVICRGAMFVVRSVFRLLGLQSGFVAVVARTRTGMIYRFDNGLVVHGSIPQCTYLRLKIIAGEGG